MAGRGLLTKNDRMVLVDTRGSTYNGRLNGKYFKKLKGGPRKSENLLDGKGEGTVWKGVEC